MRYADETEGRVHEWCTVANPRDVAGWCADSPTATATSASAATATTSTDLLEAYVYEHSERLDVLEALDDDFYWNEFSDALDEHACDVEERRARDAEIAACIVRMVLSRVCA
jgi:hypothetical protein